MDSSVPPAARPWLPAVCASVGLGLMFLSVYSACNYISAQRPSVGSWYFAWERWIPFVPAMILPYMSIDLFFSGSFFLCRDRAELAALSQRIALAIVVSAAGFLLVPLRYGWPRPAVEGWLGAVFASLNAFDQPYNLCPSLHISLREILWTVYGRHTRGWLRGALRAWFFLISLSTLLVYQHHAIDLVGGYLVGWMCIRLCREKVGDAEGLRVQDGSLPCLPSIHPLPSTPFPPLSWRARFACWRARVCAGWVAARTKAASAFTSPTTPATSTPSCSGPPCIPPPGASPGPSPRATTGRLDPSGGTSPPASSAPC